MELINKILYKAIGLLRVSTTKQQQIGDSPEKQREEIIYRAKQMGILEEEILFVELAESATGELDLQPALKALEYAKIYPTIKSAFFADFKRFTRGGQFIYLDLKKKYAKSGITLYDVGGIIKNEVINTAEPYKVNYWWTRQESSLAEELREAEKAKEDGINTITKLVLAELRYYRMGYWVGGAPLGLQAVKEDTENGRRVILKSHPEQGLWIRKMGELRLQGLQDEKIVEIVNALGFKSKLKKVRDPLDKNKIIGYVGGKKLDVRWLREYLANPVYVGIRIGSVHKTKRGDINKWIERPIKLKGEFIFTIEEFNKINKGKALVVEENGLLSFYKGKGAERYQRKTKNAPLYLYKPYVLCNCGGRLKGSAPRNGSGQPSPRYHHARCSSLSVKKMNELVETFVKNVKFSDLFIQRFNKMAVEEIERRKIVASTDSITLEKRVIALKQEKQLIVDKLKTFTSPVAVREFEKELERVDGELVQALYQRDNIEDTEVELETLLNFCKYYLEHFEALVLDDKDPVRGSAFFGSMFVQLPTFNEIESGTARLQPLFELNEKFSTSKNGDVSRTVLRWNELEANFLKIYQLMQQFNIQPQAI